MLHSQVVPFPTSNERFLRAVFGDQSWRLALIAGFVGDPENPTQADWTAHPAAKLPEAALQRQMNTYFCPSLVRGTRRVVDQFVSLHVIVVDDYGTKVFPGLPEKFLGRPASYIAETSPGNFQAGWYTEPLTDLAWVKGMLRQLRKALGAGDNLTDPVAWRRLPVGVNGKAKYRGIMGAPWQVLVTSTTNPTRITEADWPAIEANIGTIVPVSSRLTGTGTMPDPGDIEADPIVQALRLLGRIQGNLRATTMGWGFDIECPWSQDHTTRLQEGAVYVPVQARFRCLHGHCQDRTVADLREKLNELVRDETGGLFSLPYWEFDDVFDTVETVDAEVKPSRPLSAYEMTEAGAARAFVDRHKGQLRFDHARGSWFCWVGDFWREDKVQQALWWALKLAHEFGNAMPDATPAQLRTIGKVAFAQAIERAARADKQLAMDGLSWDKNANLAGAPGCEVDLVTGEILKPEPAHLVSRQLLVAPSGMKTPIWDQFLWDSTGGDPELITFLQAWSGYCLTGDISEEKLVFLYGPGGNGKGVFLLTRDTILNDYAARVPADMFMVRKFDAHPEEVARLAGIRSITASEIEEGRTFNAGRLKDFTGRDGKLTGRFMRQNTFQFTPGFKVTLVGNNQPRITNVDDAMRRRIVLVPLTQRPAVPDLTLKDRLKVEYPGILRWMIEGENLRRTMGGLAALVPASATNATGAYLADQDTLGGWAAERCVFGPGHQTAVAKAFEDYRSWCHDQGHFTEVGIQDFSRKFVEKFPDCRKTRETQGNFLVGTSISAQQDV
jgi:putative DNA primase/helicase